MSEAVDYNEQSKFTYVDYKSWELKPGERFELIYGVAYAMSAPTVSHQRILLNMGTEIRAFLKGKSCEVFVAPLDVRLFYEEDESDDTVVQPDVMVICDQKKVVEEGCRGAPDLVVEILSPSNTAIEMERKLKLYREAQVREYWVIDPKNRHISTYSLKDDELFFRIYHLSDSINSIVLPGFSLSLSTIFDGIGE